MTNKEALIATLQNVVVNDAAIDKALIDGEVDGAQVYSKSNEKSIDKCAISILQGLLSSQNISEGGFSHSTNVEGIRQRIISLAKKHDLTDILNESIPKVSSVSRW